MLAIDENHQYLRHECRYCGISIQVRLGIVRPCSQAPTDKPRTEKGGDDDEADNDRLEAAWLHFHLAAFLLQSLTPYINAVNHSAEIIGIEGYLRVEALGPAEIGVGQYLRKAESESKDIPPRS